MMAIKMHYDGKSNRMKVYLVGGAVRDQLLNYPVTERDWVVVGGTVQYMLEQGYQQVGRDFPVFLHPKTHEEYALARKERKQGKGYYGFACEFDPLIRLEDDLQRRDLTINAMAMDDQGQLIDPYHGLEDLKHKRLRHVSASFVEDPVRVLRVARFAARYHHLGFRLAEETRELMYTMVKQGELAHLVPERVWQEWQRSLGEKNPEVFIQTLRDCGALSVIIPEIHALFGVPASTQYHPEIDSGIHTLMVLSAAVQHSADPMIRFAALVHDLGKAKTPMNRWPSHHGHEQAGVDVIESLCARLRIPNDYRTFSSMVARHHLEVHRFAELKPGTKVALLEKIDAFRKKAVLDQLLLVCEADSMGRGGELEPYIQAERWRQTLAICSKITAKMVMDEGCQGPAIKVRLHELRVAAISKNKD